MPRDKVAKITHDGVAFYEIKAPPRGRQIYRLLAYKDRGWDFFVAVAKEKRSNDLPPAWKNLAATRIKAALREGTPL